MENIKDTRSLGYNEALDNKPRTTSRATRFIIYFLEILASIIVSVVAIVALVKFMATLAMTGARYMSEHDKLIATQVVAECDQAMVYNIQTKENCTQEIGGRKSSDIRNNFEMYSNIVVPEDYNIIVYADRAQHDVYAGYTTEKGKLVVTIYNFEKEGFVYAPEEVMATCVVYPKRHRIGSSKDESIGYDSLITTTTTESVKVERKTEEDN